MGFFYSGGSGQLFRRSWTMCPAVLEQVSGGSGITLKWCRARYIYSFSSERMGKREAGGMQVHPFSRSVSIEWVAKNGAVETFGVGTVYAKLVCSASEREEPYSVLVYEFITGDSLLAILVIHSLHGSILKVSREGEGDNPRPLSWREGRII